MVANTTSRLGLGVEVIYQSGPAVRKTLWQNDEGLDSQLGKKYILAFPFW